MIRTAEPIAVDPDADFSPISVDDEFAPIPEDEFNAPPEDYIAPDPDTIDGSGGLIPLESNGFELVAMVDSPLFAATGIAFVLLTLAVVFGALMLPDYRLKSRGRKVLISVVVGAFVGLISLAIVGVALKTAEGSASSSAGQFASWAGTAYQVDLTESQAQRLLDGGNAAVDYAGNRVEVRAVLASDDKLYLVDASGRELPDNPSYYFAPAPDLIPGK